jgi:hypothetical protein
MSRYNQDVTEEKVVKQLRDLKIEQMDEQMKSRVLNKLGRTTQTVKSKRSSRRWMAGMAAGAAGVCAAAGVVYVAETHSLFPGSSSATTGGHAVKSSVHKVQNPKENSTGTSPKKNPSVVKTNPNISMHTYADKVTAAKTITSIEQGVGLIGGPNAIKYSLGYGIQAKSEGAMGTEKYQWQEGNWTIITSFLTSDVKAKNIPKQMVAYLHSHSLPVPQGKGTVVVVESSNAPKLRTVIAWQEGKKVYKISKNEAPLSVLKIAVNGH